MAFTVPEGIDCAKNQFNLWYDEHEGGRWPSSLPTTFKVWIVVVKGARLFVETKLPNAAGPDVEQEMHRIVDSI